MKIDMIQHILNVSNEFPVKCMEVNGNIVPEGVDLFGKDSSEKLSKEMKTMFH